MVCHGFGGGKLESIKATPSVKEKIAMCISNLPGVLWAHVVHQGFSYDSTVDTKKHKDSEVQNRYDLIWEMTEDECDLAAIAKCAQDEGHEMKIDVITVNERSFQKGKPKKHPKKAELP